MRFSLAREIGSRQLAIDNSDQRRANGVLLTDEAAPDERYVHNLEKIRAGNKSQCARRFSDRRGPPRVNPEGNGVDLMSHGNFGRNLCALNAGNLADAAQQLLVRGSNACPRLSRGSRESNLKGQKVLGFKAEVRFPQMLDRAEQ